MVSANGPINPNLITGLQFYRDTHRLPGGFLSAVLRGDHLDAHRRGDRWALDTLPELLEWMEDYLPAECWGSPEKVENWVSDRGSQVLEDSSGQ